MDDPRIDPADLRDARFPGSSRRYDARAVDQFLRSIADRVVATNSLIDDLQTRLAEAQAEQRRHEVEPPDLTTLSDDELVRLVGEETASVLTTARHAAEDIRSKAEESAARVIREATDEAKRLVDDAKDRVVELTAEAEGAHEKAMKEAEADAERVRQEAERDAHRLLAEAREEVRSLREAVEAERAEAQDEAARVLVEAREEGRSMVAEAKEVKTRILEDLQRRRDAARDQIVRLHASRDELLSIYARARRQIDEVTGALADDEDERGGVDLIGGGVDLPDGFVGVVREHAEELPPTDDVAEVDPEVEVDAGEEPQASPAYVDDTVAPPVEPEVELTEDEPSEGGGVDALFARLRAEREQSVAKAHEVLHEPAEQEQVDEQAEEDAQVDDVQQDVADAAAPEVEGDVEHVPQEFLAPGDALEARADVVDSLDASLGRRLKRHLADEQNEVLDRLRRTGATEVDELLPDEDDHVAGYAQLALVDLAGAATAGAAAVDRAVDPPDVTELADALGATIVEPFRRRLERAIGEVDDADELDERLRALYREWKVQHIGPAVHDALLSAYARGTHAAAPAASSLRWLIDPQQGPCPDAQDNALAGAVPKGETFPTGDACPQAHPGCRCLLVVDSG